MPQGIEPKAAPVVEYTPALNPSDARLIRVPIDALSGLGGTFKAYAQYSQTQDAAALEKAKARFATDAPEYIKDRKAYMEKVGNGEIPEYQNPYARAWFYKLDAAQSLQDYEDELKSMVPDYAKARDDKGNFVAPGNFDAAAEKLWQEKYAPRYSSQTELAGGVLAERPMVVSKVRNQFVDARKIEETSLRKERIIRQGADIVSKFASPGAIVTMGPMPLVAQWDDLFDKVEDNARSRDMGAMQWTAIRGGIMAISDPQQRALALPMVRMLTIGQGADKKTVAEDSIAMADYNALRTTVRESMNAQDQYDAHVEHANLAKLYQKFDLAINGDMRDRFEAGASAKDLSIQARSWIEGNLPGKLAKYRDELTKYADREILGFSEIGNMRREQDAHAQHDRAQALQQKMERGFSMTSTILDLPDDALPAGERSRLLALDAQIQEGSAQLRGTTYQSDNDAILTPLLQFEGRGAMTAYARDTARQRLELQQEAFRKDVLRAAKPSLDPQTGQPVMPSPKALNDMLAARREADQKAANETVTSVMAEQAEQQKGLKKLLQFRLGSDDGKEIDWDKAARTLPPDYLETQKYRISVLSDPRNDFGDHELDIPTLSQYHSRLEAAMRYQAAPGAPEKIQQMQGPSPADVEKKQDQFLATYAEEAAKIRQEVARGNAPGQLGPKLRALADRLASDPAALGKPKAGEGAASQPAKTATLPQTAAAEELAAQAAEPAWQKSLTRAQWIYKNADPKGQAYRLEDAWKPELTSLPVGPRTATFFKNFADGTISRIGSSMGDRSIRDAYRAAKSDATFEAIASYDDPNLAAPQKTALTTKIIGLAGLARPEDWLKGQTVLTPSESMKEQFAAAYGNAANVQAWERNRFATGLDRYIAKVMVPRGTSLGPTDPWFTDFGFYDKAELDEWKKDGRLLQLLKSPLVGGGGAPLAAVETTDAKLSPENEAKFRDWYTAIAKKTGIDTNPDDPRHHYFYRRAWEAGATPNAEGHWPSEFKEGAHPNRFVGGVDTITGKPQGIPDSHLDVFYRSILLSMERNGRYRWE